MNLKSKYFIIFFFSFASFASASEVAVRSTLFKQIQSARESIMVEGLSRDEAYSKLIDSLSKYPPTSSEIKSFIEIYASRVEKELFEALINSKTSDLSLFPPLLLNVLKEFQKRGANFKVSCVVELGVGIPLILAGVILAYSHYHKVNPEIEIQMRYQQSVELANQNYLTAKSHFNQQLSQYNSLLQASLIERDELVRRIQSGTYSQARLITLQSRISELNTNISSYQFQMQNISASLTVLDSQYEQQINSLKNSQTKELKLTQGINRTLVLKAGLTSALVGVPLIWMGTQNCK